MNIRQIRRRHNAATARHIECRTAEQQHSEHMHALYALEDDDWDDDRPHEDRTCAYCDGDGGDPWNDYIMECPMCLGEGQRW